MRIILIVLLIWLCLHSCHRFCSYTSEVVHTTTGEVKNTVRESAHGFVVNVRKEIDDNDDCTLSVSPDMLQAGIQQGKFRIGEDSSGNYNRVSVYFVSSKTLTRPVTAKIFDADGHEYGRITVDISTKAGDARFYDFIFPSNTDIEDHSRITLE